MIETVHADGDVTVTVRGGLLHLCPFRDETDVGGVEIVWRVDGMTLELHSLTDYLDAFANSRMSHEEITDRIRHDLSTIDGIKLVSVVTDWNTAGLEVSCATSPTPQPD